MPDTDPLAAILDQIRAEATTYIQSHPDDDCPDALNSCLDHNALRLLAAIEAGTAALGRHMQWFTGPTGIRLCAGCLYPVPCPDHDAIGRALLGEEGR